MKQIVIGLPGIFDAPLEIKPSVQVVKFDGTKWVLDEIAWNYICCDFANCGVTGFRLFPWGVWGPRPYGIKSQFSPFALDGDKFNLLEFNDYYFPIVKKVMEIAGHYNIRTWFVLLDNCQFHQQAYRRWSPFVTNVNGVVTAFEIKAHAFLAKFIDRCFMEFAPLMPAYCWGNECTKREFLDMVKDIYIERIKDGKFSPAYCTYGATMENCNEWGYNADKDIMTYLCGGQSVQDLVKGAIAKAYGDDTTFWFWKEVHGIGGVVPTIPPPHALHQALHWWARYNVVHTRIWLSDDGVQPRPNKNRWVQVVNQCLPFANDFTFEPMPEGTYEDALDVAAGIYEAIYEKKPAQKYKYAPPVEPPVVIPPVEPPPPPVKPPVRKPWYKRLWHWLFGEHSWWHGWWN